MKKTAQTLLTAAMFATALGSSAAGKTPAENQTAFAANENFMTTTTVTTTTMMPLYGPPWVLSSLEEERQRNATTTTEPVTTADPVYQTTMVLYGPPWVLSSLEEERQKTGTTTATTAVNPTDIPLSGTYNLTLSVLDDMTWEKIPDLECELFVIETGKTVATWNSSDDPEHYIKKLKYEFAQRDAFGSITYGLRIRNLPENYSYAYNGGRNYAPVSGDALNDFVENGTELTTAVFLKDSNKVTSIRSDIDPYIGTTTRETAPVVLYGPPWVLYPDGDANMDKVHDARDLTLIKRAALKGLGGEDGVNNMAYELADVNRDGTVDRKDIDTFLENSLGIPKKEEPAVTTATTDIQQELETSTRATDVIVLYGPPSMRE